MSMIDDLDPMEIVQVKATIWTEMADLCRVREDGDPVRLKQFLAIHESITALQSAETLTAANESFEKGMNAQAEIMADNFNKGVVFSRRSACEHFGIPVPEWIEQLDAEVQARDFELHSGCEARRRSLPLAPGPNRSDN